MPRACAAAVPGPARPPALSSSFVHIETVQIGSPLHLVAEQLTSNRQPLSASPFAAHSEFLAHASASVLHLALPQISQGESAPCAQFPAPPPAPPVAPPAPAVALVLAVAVLALVVVVAVAVAVVVSSVLQPSVHAKTVAPAKISFVA